MCVVMCIYIVLVCSQAPKVCLRCSTDPINGAKKSSFMAFLDSSTGRPGWGLWSLGQGSNLELPKFDPRPWHTRHLAIVLPQLSLFFGGLHIDGDMVPAHQWDNDQHMPSSLGLGLPRFSTRPGQGVGCLVTIEVPVVRMCFLGLGNVMCPSASSLLEARVAIGVSICFYYYCEVIFTLLWTYHLLSSRWQNCFTKFGLA